MRGLYLNLKQAAFVYAPQKIRTWIGGRGSGKTRLIGYLIRVIAFGIVFKAGGRRVVYPPMAKRRGALMGPTKDQVKTKIWPEVQDALESHGIREHLPNRPGHFVVCKVPPRHFEKPHKKTADYAHTISFINGLSIELLGFLYDNNKRGGSYDFLILDEALETDHAKFKRSIRPLVRGNKHQYKHPLKNTLFIFSSRPWKQKAKWIERIMKLLAAKYPKRYFWVASSALDNKEVLGEEYFKALRAELTPMEYGVEVENKEVGRIPDCYYTHLDEELHCYSSYSQTHNGQEWDVNPALALDVSFDFNSAFTSCSVWQNLLPGKNDGRTGLNKQDWELRGLRGFHVKHKLVDDLVDLVCDHYKDHPKKIVHVYGGRDTDQKRKALTDKTFWMRIRDKFRARGWKAYNKVDVKWSDVDHKTTHTEINDVLKEDNSMLPKIRLNEHGFKWVIVSMLNAPIQGDYKKNKKSESDENLPQEEATHYSDSVDNYILPIIKTPLNLMGLGDMYGINQL